MKKLKYLLFIFVLFLTPRVFADTTYDMTSKITSPVNFTECGVGSYTGVELNGATNCWNTNNRYYGTLSRIYFNLPAPTGTTFEPDTAYRLSLYMATNDWRNRFGSVAVRPGSSYTNNFLDSFSFISKKQVNITFTVPYGGSTTYQTLFVDLPATNTNSLITGDSNWNLSKVTLTKLTSGSSGGSTNPSGPSTSFDDTAIINNANENTQDIINNNNSNTQDIINNNNQNTQEITDTIKDTMANCFTNIFNASAYSSSNSNFTNISISNNNITATASQSWRTITFSYNVENNEQYTLHFASPQNSSIMYYSFDNSTWTQVSKGIYSHFVSTSSTIYIRLQNTSGSGTFNFNELMLLKGNVSSFYKLGETCKSKLDDTTSAINDTNDYLKDDTDPSIDDSALNDVFGRVHFTDPLSYLLTLPTQLINKIVSMSDTCSAIDLGTLYGVHLTLPCINLENYLGSDLWTILDVILSVGLLSVILKNFYDTISNLLTLGGEKEAKEKFSMPTPMDFLAMILGGDNR